jgi:hypothetical protein
MCVCEYYWKKLNLETSPDLLVRCHYDSSFVTADHTTDDGTKH